MYTTFRPIAAALMISGMVLSTGMTSDAQTPQEKPLATRADGPLAWGPCPPIFPKGCEIAVLHGDPAKPNADVFLRVPGGYEIPTHSHTSAERMVLVAGQLRVQYKGSAAATLSPGQYAYGPSKLPHRANCLSRESCTLFIAFEGPVDAEASALLD
jgi:quercetin dioxygenase-like cupin family protein